MTAMRTMPDHRASRTPLALLAAALLLFMQAMVLEHQLDLDHHHDGEPCELCLHLAPLDHSLVGEQALPQLQKPALPPLARKRLQTFRRFSAVYHSRAPPRLS